MMQTKNIRIVLITFLVATLGVYLNSAQAEPDEIEAEFAVSWDNNNRALTTATNSPDGARLPQVAVAPNGTELMVVFNHQESGSASDNDPYFVFSNTNGTTWSTPRPIFTSNENSIQPSVTFDSQNDAHAVWVEDEVELFYAPQDTNDQTVFSAPSQIVSGAGGIVAEVDSPKIVASSGNVLDVVWIERNQNASIGFGTPDVYHARSLNGGSTWNSSSSSLLSAVASRAPDIRIGINNQVIDLVWQEELSSNRWVIRYSKSTDGGASWSFPIQISDNANDRSAERPSIVNKNGVFEVIYTEKDVGTAAEFLEDQQVRYVSCLSSDCTVPANWEASIKASGFDVGANTNNSEVIISGMATLDDCTIVSYHGTIDGLPDNNEVLFNTTSCEQDEWIIPNQVTGSSVRSIRPSLATQGDFVYMVFTRAGESPSSEDQIRFFRGELEEFVEIPTIYLPLIFR
ncbi:MAG: sialidase family protein [Chloroflexota bacterium]